MNRLKELRKQQGLTQMEASYAIGLHDNTLCQYETGKRNPKPEIWQKLADFYGVSVPYLQGYEQPTPHNRLKELRQERGLSQDELAKCLGITRQSISYYENGDRNPSKKIWKSLADFFNVSVPYIQGEIDTELIAKIAKMAFCLLEPSFGVELGAEPLPEKGKKGCIGILLITLIKQLGLNTEDIIKELSLKLEESDFASMISNNNVEGMSKAGLKLANIYDEI